MKQRLLSIGLLIIILCSLVITAFASDIGIRSLNNTSSTSTNFTINTAGKATISATFHGYKNITSGATVTSYIEKRTLGLFWTKVDIGEPNNEWVDVSTNYYDIFVHEYYLDSTGTYRATVVYEISGSGGADDVIDFNKTVTYS